MICRDDLKKLTRIIEFEDTCAVINGNCDGEVAYEDGETRNMITVGSDYDWCADYDDDDGLLSFGVWIVAAEP